MAETFQLYHRKYLVAQMWTKMCSAPLQTYPRGKMGLIPDHIRSTDQFRFEKASFDAAFKHQQRLAQFLMRNFKKEMRAESLKNRRPS